MSLGLILPSLPNPFFSRSLLFLLDCKSLGVQLLSEVALSHFYSLSVFSFVSRARISAPYLASAHTPTWWVLGLLSSVHKLSPSSDSLARPSFMAWACTHFRVVVESLRKTVAIIKVSQPRTGNCEFPSSPFLFPTMLSHSWTDGHYARKK